jgi:hypothetical protein
MFNDDLSVTFVTLEIRSRLQNLVSMITLYRQIGLLSNLIETFPMLGRPKALGVAVLSAATDLSF